MITPAEFALFALPFAVLSSIAAAFESAFYVLTVQRPHLSRKGFDKLATGDLTIGGTVASIGVVAAPWVTALFGSGHATTNFRLLSLWLLLHLLQAPYRGLLARTMQFRAIGRVEIVAQYATSFVVPFLIAIVGFPEVALSLGFVFGSMLRCGGFMAEVARSNKRRELPHQDAQEDEALFKGSITLSTTSTLGYAFENVDNLYVARGFSDELFGTYSRLFALTKSVVSIGLATVQGAVLPILSGASLSLTRKQQAMTASICLFAFGTQPLFGVVASKGAAILSTLFGEAWVFEPELVMPIMVANALYALPIGCGAIIQSTGKFRRELRIQIVALPMLLGFLVLAGNESLPKVAWAVAFVYAIRTLLYLLQGARSIGLSPSTFVFAVGPGVVAGAGVAAALSGAWSPGPGGAMIRVLASITVWLAVGVLFRRPLGRALTTLSPLWRRSHSPDGEGDLS